jgi:lysophospholipase L1-like esterase
MMNKKLSRRKFFGRSLMFSIPVIVPFRELIASAGAETAEELTGSVNPVQYVADKERIAEMIKAKDPVVWVFTGDSITHGAKHTHGYRSYPEIFAERIRWELSRVRDIVINTGISGNTTRTILDDFTWRIAQFRPDVVSLMIGTNDCAKGRITITDFENNLSTLITGIKLMGAVPVLHTPNIIIAGKSPERAALPDYVGVIRKIAADQKLILVDNYAYWQETINNSATIKVLRDWLNDPLHPDGEGHSQIARLMFRELSIFDPKASTCGGEYYEGEH